MGGGRLRGGGVPRAGEAVRGEFARELSGGAGSREGKERRSLKSSV